MSSVNMKMLLDEISVPIREDVKMFQDELKTSLSSGVKLINTVIKYITRKKGKQLRPRLTLLAARLCGEPTSLTYKAAALVEILHVATLIHDDVVDDADTRRGIPTVKRIWKNKIAILVGDYMFSKALANIIHLRDFDALEVLSSASTRLSEGEILQIEKAIKKEMSEETYLKMVGDKTASLFSASCKLGAITATEDIEKREALSRFGEKLGVAFQIKDDLFDIMGTLEGVGKPTGFDVKKNMVTLPLIHLFATLEGSEKKRIQSRLKYHAKRNEISEVRRLIESHGGIDYTRQRMKEISEDAKRELEIFPDSPVKSGLMKILDFNLERQF